MALIVAVADADAERIGAQPLAALLRAYDAGYPSLNAVADVALLSPEAIQLLNRTHRQEDSPTDVLSFPLFTSLNDIAEQPATEEPLLIGSIVICPEKAIAYDETLIQLLHHGLLHLLGFDHESAPELWHAEETRILELLATHGLIIPPALPSYDSI
jgi:probable rRNA maturation factor